MTWEVKTSLLSEVPTDVIQINQKHTGHIIWAHEAATQSPADGIAVRSTSGQSICIRTADCLPLVLVTPAVICALHVSRKSLIAGLLESVPNYADTNTLEKVYIGPHICADHFVFEHEGPDIAKFAEQYPFACHKSTVGLHLSLHDVVEKYLERWRVNTNIIVRDGRCTFEAVELPSYRRSLQEGIPCSDHVATTVFSA